jgi:tRNA modification GTPase
MRIDGIERPIFDLLPFQAGNGQPLSLQPIGRIVFGRWGSDLAEEVVVCHVNRETLEIHCHGGDAAAKRILKDLEAAGCRTMAWQELIHRVDGALAAELQAELSRATTTRTAEFLLEQADGLLRSSIESLITADDEAVPRIAKVREMLRWAEFGVHLTRPWKVVVAGRPNVGKSSLINVLLGYTRSIVFDQPGTTRDVVTAVTAVDGWPIELSDTAGIRQSDEPLEAAGIERARSRLADSDLAVLLIDVSTAPSDEDRRLLAALPEALVVAHRCDLPRSVGARVWDERSFNTWLRVSSKTGEGVDALTRALLQRLVPEIPPTGAPLPVTPRQVGLLQQSARAAEAGDWGEFTRSMLEILG